MPDVIVAAAVLSLLFAVLMTIIAAKLLRENRTRTTSRIETLQALAAEPSANAPHMAPPIAPTIAPFAPARILDSAPTQSEEMWDFALRDEPVLPVSAPVQRSRPVQELASARTAAPMPHANIELRSSKFEVRTSQSAVPDHDLFETPIQPAPSRRWTWMAAAGLVMVLGGGTFYVVSSGVITRAMATHDANVTTANAVPIELLSLRYTTDAGNFVVTGLVQNPPKGVSLHGVQAVVYLFDTEGKYIGSNRASLESSVLSPGGESGFVVRVPAGTDVSKYRVSFQHEDGAAVQHVDRRGALPANTTGDAVEAPPANTKVVTARKNG